jgi:hypothetical protein
VVTDVGGRVALVDPQGRLVAVAEGDGGALRLARVWRGIV